MANEAHPTGRRYILGVLESSYGSSPGFSPPGEEFVCREVSTNTEYEDLQVTHDSPLRQGLGSVAGMQTSQITLSDVYLTGISVTDTNTRPAWEPVFRALGFSAPAYGAGPPKTLTYTHASYGYGSAQFLYRMETEASGTGRSWRYNGCRGTGKIKIPANGLVTVDAEINAKTLTIADYTASVPALVYQDTEGEFRKPLVHKGSTITIVTVDGSPATYGGVNGSCEIDLNNGIEISADPEAANGVGTVRIVGGEPISGSSTIETVPVADFDPHALMAARTPLHQTIELVPIDDTDETVTIDLYYEITGVSESDEGGRSMQTLTWRGLTSESTPGSSVDAGQRMGNNLTITFEQA